MSIRRRSGVEGRLNCFTFSSVAGPIGRSFTRSHPFERPSPNRVCSIARSRSRFVLWESRPWKSPSFIEARPRCGAYLARTFAMHPGASRGAVNCSSPTGLSSSTVSGATMEVRQSTRLCGSKRSGCCGLAWPRRSGRDHSGRARRGWTLQRFRRPTRRVMAYAQSWGGRLMYLLSWLRAP